MKGAMEKVREIWREGRRVGKEDPRRIVHSFKVGLALALVSSFYYYQPLYDNFGVNAMWAVMTVVVVFEFSVGATLLGKGINRAVATLVAGGLGVGAHHLASLSGPTIEPILFAVFVFVQAALSTFVRFFPRVKARYDYGILIFILTFSLISVSGFREDEILDLAHKRLSIDSDNGRRYDFEIKIWKLAEFGEEYFEATDDGDVKEVEKKRKNLQRYKSVLNSKSNEEALCRGLEKTRYWIWRIRDYLSTVIMGGVSCVLISIFICPVWAGQDLHSLLASNFDTLSHFLQGYDFEIKIWKLAEFGEEYFEATDDGDVKEVEKKRKNLQRYKSVLNSKSNEEALANFAKWEPRHGQFRFRHPWKQYLAVAALLRQCAYWIDALNSYITSDFQIPMDIKKKLEEPLTKNELGVKKINERSILNDVEPLQMIALMTTVSLLIDIVNLTEKIAESVHELASAARFENKKKSTVSSEKTVSDFVSTGRSVPIKSQDDHVVTILCDDDISNTVDQSRVESSVDSCHHVAIKIDDEDDSVHEKHEDGEIRVHTNCVAAQHS
ncbi:hypothetical protein DY000_02054529 [Brassica cretica]|uniref:Aluminum-activated malate transporter n=1 Tax=Brassica cretica TaxID=69181 RepID=A0ABQ7AFA0_BRACR|nr:hypothetical protein DY000_02054529 [Brassica cretica]